MVARKLPADSELVRMRDQGLTHQQIADEVFRRTGVRVARSTVSVALTRAGETTHRQRYSDTIPWTVPQEHSTEYAFRMLRLLGRDRRGLPMTDEDRHRLGKWLADLERERLIVAHCPDVSAGEPSCYYVAVEQRDHGDRTLPIRIAPVERGQIAIGRAA